MYRDKFNIPENHSLNLTDNKVKNTEYEEIEIEYFDEINENDKVVAKYVVFETAQKKPPFGLNISYEKLDLEGNRILFKDLGNPTK